MVEMAAWHLSERAARAREGRPIREQWRGPDADLQAAELQSSELQNADLPDRDGASSAVPQAPLDELINERSALTVEALEEQERERAAALTAAVASAVAHAPLRVASASRRTIGTVMTTLFVGSAGALGGALRSTGLIAGAGLGPLRRRKVAGQPSDGPRRPIRRPARRLGAAAALALAVAAPAAAAPAPWGALVGFSADGTGIRPATVALPSDLATANALGPLPAVLPERGLASPGAAGRPVGLDSAADPAAAGLPLDDSDRTIPSAVLTAYQQAADRLAAQSPGCQLQWTLLAGIGKVESNHARGWSGTAALTADGTTTPPILGPVLDGTTPGTAVLPDTDGGRLDGNASFDRAVGPMQFVPGTWKLVGQDGNGDGKADPNNVFDAALSAGGYLCAGDRDLGVPAMQAAAVLAYNPSAEYVRTVLAWATAYGTGAPVDLSMPSAAVAAPPEVTGGQVGGFPVPVSGSSSLPYADSEGGTAASATPSTGDMTATPDVETPATTRPTTKPVVKKPVVKKPVVKKPVAKKPVVDKPTDAAEGTGSSSGGSSGGASGGTTTKPTEPGGTTQPTRPEPASLTMTRSAISDAKATNPDTGRAGLRFTVTVSASKASSALLRLRVADSGDLRVTGIGKVVALKAGTNTVTLNVDGGFLGDSGVDGPYRITTTYLETDDDGTAATGATTRSLGAGTRSRAYSAADFAYYVPSIARIDGRVTEFTDRGLVTSAARDRLRALLREQTPDLDAVRTELERDKAAGSVKAEAFVRLDSLVQRRLDPPAGTKPTRESTPTSAPPGRDPELAAGRSIR